MTNDLRLALASGLPRGRYALTVHDPVPHPGDEVHGQALKMVRRALRRRASLVFVHSEALAEELDATGDVKAPIEVVPHGAATADFRPPPPDSLLFFGRMSYYKGLDVLLDAMPAVWAERPQVKLTVAGEGSGPSTRSWRTRASPPATSTCPRARWPASMKRQPALSCPTARPARAASAPWLCSTVGR